jgi:hypothetical protein
MILDLTIKFFFVALLLLQNSTLPAQNSLFMDISGIANITHPGASSGVAAADFNNDGLEDMYFSLRTDPNRLYRNTGNGTFVETGAEAGVNYEGYTRTSIWGDINNDGFIDLYLGNNESQDILYMNNGDGTFTDISDEAGIANLNRPYSVNMSDVNLDGFLDIYISNFLSQNVLYINNGDLTFSNWIYPSAALDDDHSMGAVFFDYDNDGDDDLYLTHDGFSPNILYENNGAAHFTNVSEDAGVDYLGFGMGTDVADINNDGFLDIYITNLYANVLFLNNGNGTFTDITATAGVGDAGMGWGTNFFDYNNDGWVDIYVTNDSHFSPYPNVLYKNMGNNTFDVVEEGYGVSSMLGGYGSACLDLNLDGHLDLAVANTGNSDFNQLFRNMGSGGNWISFRLEGVESNRSAIGARIMIIDDSGRQQIDEVAGGSGFASQNSLVLHFGLDQASTIDSLVINWPNGIVQYETNISAGCNYQIREGEAPVASQFCTTTSVYNQQSTDKEIILFPNPASDHCELRFILTEPQTVDVEIYDINGCIVFRERDYLGSVGQNSINMKFSQGILKERTGLHYVQVRIKGLVYTQKLIKL